MSIPTNFFLLVSILVLVAVHGQGDVHRCVHSSTKLAKRGRGNTETSCMGCNPAQPLCSSGCQQLIDKLYENCDEVCLPYGYYFDPQWELEGCWKDNIRKVKIKVERCGCNAGSSTSKLSSFSLLTLFSIVFTVLVSLYIQV